MHVARSGRPDGPSHALPSQAVACIQATGGIGAAADEEVLMKMSWGGYE